jgi:hypothetical protein
MVNVLRDFLALKTGMHKSTIHTATGTSKMNRIREQRRQKEGAGGRKFLAGAVETIFPSACQASTSTTDTQPTFHVKEHGVQAFRRRTPPTRQTIAHVFGSASGSDKK